MGHLITAKHDVASQENQMKEGPNEFCFANKLPTNTNREVTIVDANTIFYNFKIISACSHMQIDHDCSPVIHACVSYMGKWTCQQFLVSMMKYHAGMYLVAHDDNFQLVSLTGSQGPTNVKKQRTS